MESKPKSLHVNPVGENWEVESDAITLGQAETKSEAIELAKELASTAKVSNISVHTSDGLVETDIPWINQPKSPASNSSTALGRRSRQSLAERTVVLRSTRPARGL
jgi:hypothetical protein